MLKSIETFDKSKTMGVYFSADNNKDVAVLKKFVLLMQRSGLSFGEVVKCVFGSMRTRTMENLSFVKAAINQNKFIK